jgi:hypothetical protein
MKTYHIFTSTKVDHIGLHAVGVQCATTLHKLIRGFDRVTEHDAQAHNLEVRDVAL